VSSNAVSKGTSVQGGQWFHGSPEKLEKILAGSWVTPYKEVARAFSHKPSCISASDDFREIKHNGTLPGYLYIVAEDVRDQDLTLLPGTDDTHWQTRRELRIEWVEDVPILEAELLTEQELEDLQRMYPGAGSGTGYWSSRDCEAVNELNIRGLSNAEIADA